MRLFRTARWLLVALLLPLIPAPKAHAGVFISVGFAPPVLPVYVQPMCPAPNLMWVPGYWAYGPDGYYWVPGAWVPAPYEGALWTPPYWGWDSGLYVFHPGYWGWNVGYYGGVNYGYGYYGRGFVGGRWHDRDFEYNRAVMHVDDRVIRTTYIDRTVIREHEIVHDSRVSYNGGPGGIRYQASPQERLAMREQHLAPTRAQQEHVMQARSNRASYFNANHGRPQQVAIARPLAPQRVAPPAARQQNGIRQQQPGVQNQRQQPQRPSPQYQRPEQQRPQYQQRPQPQYQERPQPQRLQQRPQPQYQDRQQPQRPTPQYQRPEQQRPQPQYQQRPQPQYQQHPQPQYQERGQPQRPQYQRPEPQSRPESRPREERRPQR